MAYQTEYPVVRRPVYASRGMVATGQPLAAQAGLGVLQAGGNAVDAAIATAAALTVVEPTANGIGGDLFALVWAGGKLHGLNASGAAPAALTLNALQERHGGEMPRHGWTPVTVPGAVRGWADLHRAHGRLDFAQVLAPAIRYARDGFPLSPVASAGWSRTIQIFQGLKMDIMEEWFRTFAPDGFAPEPGALWRSEGHARTLEAIASSYSESFYTGELAAQIDAHARATGGLLRAEDLAAHQSEWVTPISAEYGGHRVHEIPPNGQGIAALIALNILEGQGLPDRRDDPDGLHLQIEAMKRGFHDAHQFVADMRHSPVDVEHLLSQANTHAHRERLSDKAHDPATAPPSSGGTVYLATADDEGNMVSLIQSNYMGFGSGVVVPGTGIGLHNRGHNFNLEPGHPNVLAPGKRPYHTIIPGFLTRNDGTPVGPFGVMGGFMQPQGHLQVVLNTVRYGMNPQQALDAPRWQWLAGLGVEVEAGLGATLARELARRGHRVSVQLEPSAFGRGQIIWRNPETGVLEGGTESRTDGHIAAW
ncbi:gamma-glutamyltransferase family protein [Deinococcus humi]|uniref:Gamma-glutamyltranspeptidase/glutathione hydrolase n=1 Tax=Deinococcus humi TaxID=662880 RepID=A0A7W8JX74_9DEIO|nr:gamma-glutamyltransferase family protein [Deinococcus humi]MBB5364660.1 gamma-glutamyltranspeptidase/glutathione hydrolase [Deinococcus humi]GGO34157.1 gamma-glutamyltransferase [Deinococcus humi]